MAPLTNPRSPIVVAGQEFTQWEPVGQAHRPEGILAVDMDDEWAAVFLGQLGQYVPGLVEDGSAVEFYVQSVQWNGPNKHEVQLIPSIRTWGDLL